MEEQKGGVVLPSQPLAPGEDPAHFLNRPEFQPPAHIRIRKPRLRYVFALVGVFILVLAAGGGLVWYRLGHSAQSKKLSTANSAASNSLKSPGANSPSAPTCQTNQTASATPTLTSATINGVNVDYVTMPTGKEDSQTLGPTDTTQGHYLYVDSNGPEYNSTTRLGGTLLYDGATVYRGAGLDPDWIVLSHNGLHYAYAVIEGHAAAICVDSKLVQTVNVPAGSNTSLAFRLLGVSDNGADYAYILQRDSASSQSSNILDVYKNGKVLMQDTGWIYGPKFTPDLAHFLFASDRTGYPIFRDGVMVVATSNQTDDLSLGGAHYITLTGTADTVLLDGRAIGTITPSLTNTIGSASTNDVRVNDDGTYAFTDLTYHKINVNGAVHTIPASIPVRCVDACTSDNLFAISQHATHYIIGNNRPDLADSSASSTPIWFMDGQNVNLVGNIESLEFTNDNTLYVYRWLQ